MTDTELDIDPALDAHLRRTFREVAQTVTDPPTTDNVIRLVTAPAPLPRTRRWAWLGAAAAAGVVAGAGLMALADRDNNQADVPVASTTPAVVEPDLDELGRTCADDVAAQRAQLPVELRDYGPSLPEPDGATVVLFDTQLLLVIGESSFILCQVDHGSTVQADFNVYRLPVLAPEKDGLLVVNRTSSTGADPTHGPGWVRIIGRAGSDVDAIDLEWIDGTIVSGHVERGWFLIEGPIPSGVPDSDERLRWTLMNGDQHSGRADLLDEPHDVEACAETPGCVKSRLGSLVLQAGRLGRDEQVAILEDMDVTDAELAAAQRRFAACFNASGTGATAIADGDGNLAIGTSGIDDFAEREYMDDVHALCAAAHTEFVDQAWVLLDAQRRVAEG